LPEALEATVLLPEAALEVSGTALEVEFDVVELDNGAADDTTDEEVPELLVVATVELTLVLLLEVEAATVEFELLLAKTLVAAAASELLL
jgi:hypothetical protein